MSSALVPAAVLALALPLAQAERDAELADWREALAADVAIEVVEGGLAKVRGSGPYAADGEAIALVARALFEIGREAEAVALVEEAEVERGAAPLAVERARFALLRDELERVEELLAAPPGAATPLRHPGEPEAWLVLGKARARAGDLETAAPLFERFVAESPLHPEAPSAWHQLFLEAIRRGDTARAEELRRRETEMRRWHAVFEARRIQARRQPDEPLPKLGLALCWMEVGELDRARAILEPLARDHPDFCRGWFHLAEVRRVAGDLEGALAGYERALACDETDAKSRFNRALLLMQRGAGDEAAREFARIAASEAGADPLFKDAHLHLARWHLARGERAAAEESHARYRALGGTRPLDG